MSYSDLYFTTKRRPPIVLYVLAFLALGGFAFTFLRPSAPSARASKENLVYHSVVNLSPHQAGIYYQTVNPTKSWVIYGKDKNNLDRVAFDERDTEDNKLTYNLHYVLLKDLDEKNGLQLYNYCRWRSCISK